ncbi:MAG TPA: tRNA glutamyl-Q(34) synthetase GluQRS [Methylomusa anaerophila]|uniref:Glutamyl-Q tRNA(Asp) synthetase n=1 Tax=Methylomusa anaerophila TaxID=1930071 RepID=A0A348AFT4_9FIRM|nr:tRNA glutamyl-Q(34) synthetase GluQRS [Methylomusa anaerophila]BBB89932.1 glutamate--tRNA ligase 1 [Methylomusa anaerophila]HML88341.1 tRNA glutamyl-Q(34) synthetase GluQRS [Methylomusa anaerophila]
MSSGKKMRGRFAPSPTGEMHLGNAWTALLAWLQVRAAGGVMVLRIEDLDPDRSRQVYINGLIADMKWLGLDWDEGPDAGGPFAPYCQNERRDLYQIALERLAAAGLVYPCYCTRAELAVSAPHAEDNERVYSGTCRRREKKKNGLPGRSPALRLAVPDGAVDFYDEIQGYYCQHVSQSVGDFVVRRSDGVHAYQLAVVVDDAAMEITHVLRGDDLLSSTPRQILLYQVLNLKQPVFAHVPLLYGGDGHRLSKRQKDLSIAALRYCGIKPERIIGFLAWKAGLIAQKQSLTAYELVDGFNICQVRTKPVVVGSCIIDELLEEF